MTHTEQLAINELLSLGIKESDYYFLVSFHPMRAVFGYRFLGSGEGQRAFLEHLLAYTKAKHIGNPSFGMFSISTFVEFTIYIFINFLVVIFFSD
jgi:hypothetical protein